MKLKKLIYLFAATIITLVSCKKAYNPPQVTAPSSYLVVEGTINTGNDSTIIKLSHTINLSESTTSNAEAGAQVSIETENGSSYTLQNKGDGTYVTPPLNLSNSNKYRLKIVNGSNTYASDYVQAKASPPIDSLTSQIQATGLQISVNTHDAANKTTYYRWSYQETWEFHVDYFSSYIADNNTIRLRNRPAEDIYYCWQSANSNDIVLGSSARLSQDVISQNPVTHIPSSSEKISFLYSIYVKQYALDQQAFEFWQNLRKITEQLGSIFDAQPSQLTGNIHNVANATEPVIGYISAGSVSKLRLFVDKQNLPTEWRKQLPFGCSLLSFSYDNPSTHTDEVSYYLYSHFYTPIDPIQKPDSPKILGFRAASNACADCTTRGTTIKPSYWP